MISEAEIVSTLTPLNGVFFNIPDLPGYARKLTTLGKCVCLRDEHANELHSYVLYYDNGPAAFISMVWTHPKFQRLGLASRLISEVIRSTHKDVFLEVQKHNPARQIYVKLKFVELETQGEIVQMGFHRRLAIMQPYVFPYLGYFHLIEASRMIVFYDDVNYIKKGWINRNRILLNDAAHLFTVPIKDASQNRLINQTPPCISAKWKDTFYKQLNFGYRKAPYYSDVIDRIVSVFEPEYGNIADLAIHSILTTYDYLGLKINHAKSSVCAPGTQGLEKADRLMEITKALGFVRYVNAHGGVDLYSKDDFRSKGIELNFVKSNAIAYKQFSDDFIPDLSIIDVLMFNSKETILDFFASYALV